MKNHNGANLGVIEDENGYIIFHARKDWSPGYSAHQLEIIVKRMRAVEKSLDKR